MNGEQSHQAATLIGYHGKENFGDDIFFEFLSQWIGQHFNCPVLNVTCPIPIDPVSSPFNEIVPIGKSHFGISRFRWLSIAKALLRSKLACFGGGTIFQSTPCWLGGICLVAAKTINSKLKVVAIGTSFHHKATKFENLGMRFFFRRFDHILVRDDSSKAELEAIGVTKRVCMIGDIALGYAPLLSHHTVALNDGPASLAIFLNHPRTDPSSGIAERLLDALAEGIERNVALGKIKKLIVIATCENEADGDKKYIDQFLNKLSAETKNHVQREAHRANQPKDIIETIKQCDAVISSRMHPGIAAAMLSIPVMQISYARKIPAFYDSNQLDTKWLFDVAAVTSKSVDDFVECIGASSQIEESASSQEKLRVASNNFLSALEDLAADLASPPAEKDHR